MLNQTAIYEFFRQCPQLSNLLSIAAEQEKGNTVILPQSASQTADYNDFIDTTGYYQCEIQPYPSIYEEYQINCFEWYDTKDTNPPRYNENVLTYEQVCEVCEWINEQDRLQNFPSAGENIVSMECFPYVPRIKYVDPDNNTIGYYITVRIRYVNKMRQKRTVEYGY